LKIENPKVSKKITHLLSNSFFPQSKSFQIQVERCFVLIEDQPDAARKFYYYLHNFLTTQDCNFFFTKKRPYH